MLRNVAPYLFSLMVLSHSSSAFSWELGEGEALLLFSIVESKRTADSFLLVEMTTGERVRLNWWRDKPLVVAAGRYYLHSFRSMYDDVKDLKYARPDDADASFVVDAGTATYIGNWIVTEKRNLRGVNWEILKDYSPETLEYFLEKHPELASYPLYLTTEEGGHFPYSWGEVRNAGADQAH